MINERKHMHEQIISILGQDERAILRAVGQGFTDIASIHLVTGVPVPCIERKIGALVEIKLLQRLGNEIHKISSESKVLLVDDDPDILEFMRTVLEVKGFKVIHARNGVKAIELLENDVLDEISCVITDFLMPQMNGQQLCNVMRCKFPRKIHVFLMSAYIEPTVMESMDGFDATFAKPINIDRLVACVGACIQA